MVNTSRDNIVAYVSPRSIGGRSVFDPAASLVSSRVGEYFAELGFDIVGVSPAAITIEASPELYQKVFRAAIRAHPQPVRAKGLKGQYPKKVWRFQRDPEIPAELRPQVEKVVFPSATVVHTGIELGE